MTSTDILALPYLAAAQASKHVTHNEALRMLDAVVQIGVTSRSETSPPATPGAGDRYLVPDDAQGAWAGQDGTLAAWQDGAWAFFTPRQGWVVFVADEPALLIHEDGTWQGALLSGTPGSLSRLGIGASTDETNRLAIAAPASLFNHAGNGHQTKINKATDSDTASIVFQTGFSGRAEFGCIGSDAFALKVSADGASFSEALRADPASGAVSAPGNLRLAIACTSDADVYADGDRLDCTAGLDSHAAFDAASDAITVPHDMNVLAILTLHVRDVTGGNAAALGLQKNVAGSPGRLMQANIGDYTGQDQVSLSGLISLSAGDTLFLEATLPGGATGARFTEAALTLINLT